MLNEKRGDLSQETPGGEGMHPGTENPQENPLTEIEEAELTALLQEYNETKKNPPKYVEHAIFKKEMDAKNQAVAFILANGLYEDYKKFVAETEVDDWQAYNIIACYFMFKDKEAKEQQPQ